MAAEWPLPYWKYYLLQKCDWVSSKLLHGSNPSMNGRCSALAIQHCFFQLNNHSTRRAQKTNDTSEEAGTSERYPGPLALKTIRISSRLWRITVLFSIHNYANLSNRIRQVLRFNARTEQLRRDIRFRDPGFFITQKQPESIDRWINQPRKCIKHTDSGSVVGKEDESRYHRWWW